MLQFRELAAIMFADIVGKTALMGDDEQKHFDFHAETGKYNNHCTINSVFYYSILKQIGYEKEFCPSFIFLLLLFIYAYKITATMSQQLKTKSVKFLK